MPIGKLDHYSIRTLDLAASENFYTRIMGFTIGFRPPFNFPGLWLYNGAAYPETLGVVHIIGVDLNKLLHNFDQTDDVAEGDLIAMLPVRRLFRRRTTVEDSGQRT